MYSISLLHKPPYHLFIILRPVRKHTAGTVFDPLSTSLLIYGIPRAVLLCIQGTETKQAVKIPASFMTGKIFTFPVLKKTVRIFHIDTLVHNLVYFRTITPF